VASMINRFVFAHPYIYIEITPLKENKQNVSILSKRPCTDKNYSQSQTELSFSKVCFEKWNLKKISAEIFL
jgi:hypothetical protein